MTFWGPGPSTLSAELNPTNHELFQLCSRYREHAEGLVRDTVGTGIDPRLDYTIQLLDIYATELNSKLTTNFHLSIFISFLFILGLEAGRR